MLVVSAPLYREFPVFGNKHTFFPVWSILSPCPVPAWGESWKIYMKVYAFDVDETLYLSHGPVQWEALVALRAEGHVLGLCGNWAAVTLQVPEWHRVLSFIGPSLIGTDKANFLAMIKQYVPAEEHVMVGNDHSLRAYASPDDRRAADAAGWRFLSEGAFAAGDR